MKERKAIRDLERKRSTQHLYETFSLAGAVPGEREYSSGSIYLAPLFLHDRIDARRISMLCHSNDVSTQRSCRISIYVPESGMLKTRDGALASPGLPSLAFRQDCGQINVTGTTLRAAFADLGRALELDPEDLPFLAFWPQSSNFFSSVSYGSPQNVSPRIAYSAAWSGASWPSNVTPQSFAPCPYASIRSELGVRVYGIPGVL